jgi:hypothetical protein
MAVGHLDKALAITTIYFLPRLIGFGRVSLPVRFFAITPGAIGGIAASGALGTDGIGRRGFFGRETVDGGFFGMEHIMRL